MHRGNSPQSAQGGQQANRGSKAQPKGVKGGSQGLNDDQVGGG